MMVFLFREDLLRPRFSVTFEARCNDTRLHFFGWSSRNPDVELGPRASCSDCARCGGRSHNIWRLRHHWRRGRSEEHTSELQSLMSNTYTVFCSKKKKKK